MLAARRPAAYTHTGTPMQLDGPALCLVSTAPALSGPSAWSCWTWRVASQGQENKQAHIQTARASNLRSPQKDAFVFPIARRQAKSTFQGMEGPLPESVANGDVDEKINSREAKADERNSKVSVSPSPSNASSNTSLTTPTTSTPPEGPITEAIPGLNLTLQQVKELTHQKRSNKRAPPMDWTKKNELFSNL